jgi:hypothetical protein
MVEQKKFLWRGARHDTAGFEQNDARREKQGFAQIVGDEDNGFAKAARERAEFALEFRAGDRIERAEGLVHQKNRRIGSESAGYADTLPLAPGKFTGVAASESRTRIKTD